MKACYILIGFFVIHYVVVWLHDWNSFEKGDEQIINFQAGLSDSQLCKMSPSCRMYFYQCPDVWLLWPTKQMALWTNTVPAFAEILTFQEVLGEGWLIIMG